MKTYIQHLKSLKLGKIKNKENYNSVIKEIEIENS